VEVAANSRGSGRIESAAIVTDDGQLSGSWNAEAAETAEVN